MKMMIISDNINNDITIKDISLRQKSIIIGFCLQWKKKLKLINLNNNENTECQ